MTTGCSSTTVTGGTTSTTAPKVQANFAGDVSIGHGRKMYIQCWGSGSPTVVLISGKGYAGDLWNSPLTKGGPRVFPPGQQGQPCVQL